jgi:hypothetical protein
MNTISTYGRSNKVVTRFSLEKTQNAKGLAYSKAKDGPYLECDDEPDAPDYEYDPNVPDIRAAILYIEAAQASLESVLGSLESVHESLTRG